MSLTVGTRLGPYEIVAPLGAGGMGEVYRARDSKLHRDVAIKVLPEAVAADPDRLARFEREAQALAALNHPNIAAIYAVEDRAIVMELVAGEDLSVRIQRGPIPLADALPLARQIADALAAAHEAGIIHRDLKPANIKVKDDGTVKVLDFGLAKAFDPGSKDPGLHGDAANSPTISAHATQRGVILGTAAYMAPEQARGKAVDKRADIWAFGVVLYEMLTGQRLFAADEAQDTLVQVLTSEPDWTALPPATPALVRRLLTRCLTKDVKQRLHDIADARLEIEDALKALEEDRKLRYQTASGMRADLQRRDSDSGKSAATAAEVTQVTAKRRWLSYAAISVVFVAIAGTATYLYFSRSNKTVDSIAVLPFVNVSGDPGTDYLSDGISESLINSLSQLSRPRVKSWSSTSRYRGRDVDVQKVGRDLEVQAVLTGKITQRGEALSISAELVDVEDGSQIWGQRYDRRLADIQPVQEEIVKDISGKLRLRLTGEEQKLLTKRYTENAEAYRLYLQGRFYWNQRNEEGFKKAIQYFDQAVRQDQKFALAFAGLADCHILLGRYYMLPVAEALIRAKEAAAKALDIDGSLAEAHASLGFVKHTDFDWLGAESEFVESIQLNPSYATARQWHVWSLVSMGRLQEALAEARRAQELDPSAVILNVDVGKVLYWSRSFDLAIEQLQKTVLMDSGFARTHRDLGLAYIHNSMYKEGIAALENAARLSNNGNSYLPFLGYAYGLSGQETRAMGVLNELTLRARRGSYVPAIAFAAVHIGLSRNDTALQWLEKAFDERNMDLALLRVDPFFDSLRSDPRFQALLDKMKFPK